MTVVVFILFAIGGWVLGGAIWFGTCVIAGLNPVTLESDSPSDENPSTKSSTDWATLLGIHQLRQIFSRHHVSKLSQLLFQLGTALYCAAAVVMIDNHVRLLAAIIFLVPLTVVTLLDSWVHQVFSNVIIFGGVLGLFFSALGGFSALKSSFQGMLVGMAVIAGFYFLGGMLYETRKRGPVGMVDVLLGAMIGTMVRWPLVVTALFIGAIFAVLVGVSLIFVFRTHRGPRVRYGPFLCLGTLLVLVAKF